MRILVISPPQVLSYFNAGHRLALYQVAGFLRTTYIASTVRVVDAAVERYTWKDVGDLLYQGNYDLIAIMNDLDGVDGFGRFVSYARSLSPQSFLVTFGRLSSMNPGYFERFDLDGIVQSGDFELGVSAALDKHSRAADGVVGVRLRQGDVWIRPQQAGATLEPERWHLPKADEVPYQLYDDLYSLDSRKFPGLPNRRELVVPVARGCPIGCSYCEVPTVFGLRERRLGVSHTIDYIAESFRSGPFEYVSFYAPTFTLDKEWTARLCDEFIRLGSKYPWKCCTTIHHLNEELVRSMGKSGCVRISVGLETLEAEAHGGLPRAKRKSESELRSLAEWCSGAGVELNCFVVVGLPGTTIGGAKYTIETVRSLGARVRPTVYTPLETMSPSMSESEMSSLNRQIFAPGVIELDGSELSSAYALIFDTGAEASSAADRVQRVGEVSSSSR